MANYQYVIDSSFRPFSMQEMLAPLMIYKDAYEKQEAVLDELNKNTDTFKYLEQVAKDNPESEAAQIYNTYASDLRRYGDDFSQNGLSMNNRRGLLDMKRRYQGEIGLLDAASKAMEEVRNLRKTSKDPSMIYAEDNLNIDQFLYGRNPNLYGISGNDLYTRGAAAGKAASSRMYKAGETGSVLGGYYRNWKETRGVSQESIADFMNSTAVQQEVDNMLKAEGVTGNLTGANYERARQQILNGIYAGIVYEESNKPVEDKSKISAAQAAQLADNRDARALSAAMYGYKKVNGKWVRDPNAAPAKGNNASSDKKSDKSGKGGSSTNRYTQLSKGVKVVWDDDPTVKDATYTSTDLDTSPSAETEHKGRAITYDELPQYAKDRVDAILGPEGNVDLHRYYFRPYTSGIFDDNEAELEIIPYKVSVFNGEDASMEDDADLEGGN